MSGNYDRRIDVAPARDVGHEYPHAPSPRPVRETDAAAPTPAVDARQPSVIVVLSPEAQAVLDGLRKAERADLALRGAKEIAAAVGVSEAKAVQAAQPSRSPPPAKGAALFQANLAANSHSD